MISGATEEELEIANDRADLLLKIRELENINDKLSSALNSAENKIYQLTNNWNELEELIINEINDAQNELNVILQGDNLDYKNECTKEFNCIKNALEILLDKMKEIKNGGNYE